MAEAFQITGPAVLEIGANAAGLAVLGHSDNDDLFSIDFEDRNEPLEATDTGRVPAEFVFVGRIAIISGILSKWDPAQDDELVNSPHAAPVEGKAGTIGRAWVADGDAFAIQVGPLTPTATKPAYRFERCVLDGPGSFRIFDFGNIGKKLAFQIVAIPDGGNPSLLYSLITS